MGYIIVLDYIFFFIIIFKRISIYPTEKSLKADKIASASYASARCYNSNKYKRINLVSPLPGLRTARYASERTPRLCFLISASSVREGCGGRDAGASCLSLWKIANHLWINNIALTRNVPCGSPNILEITFVELNGSHAIFFTRDLGSVFFFY